MRILLTNDDGIDSGGLRTLKTQLEAEHEVWVVAPTSERSACSHALTIRHPIRVLERREREFAVDGTPADCVLVGLISLINRPVDLVVSGINRGPNLGTDILFSGTVAAARQGALKGIPSFALSLFDPGGKFDYGPGARFALRELPRFASVWSDDHFLNINFPAGYDELSDWAVTAPSRRFYTDRYRTTPEPDGGRLYSLEGQFIGCREEPDGDYGAVRAGLVSITALPLHPAGHEKGNAYRALKDCGERSRQ